MEISHAVFRYLSNIPSRSAMQVTSYKRYDKPHSRDAACDAELMPLECDRTLSI